MGRALPKPNSDAKVQPPPHARLPLAACKGRNECVRQKKGGGIAPPPLSPPPMRSDYLYRLLIHWTLAAFRRTAVFASGLSATLTPVMMRCLALLS